MTIDTSQEDLLQGENIAPLKPGSSDWLAAAEAIGERIQQCARPAANGCLVWLDPAKPRADDGKPVRLGPHLYSGTMGVVLFLAALARVTGRNDYRDTALRGLSLLRRQMAHLAGNPAAAEKLKFRLGGVIGLGGYIYGFLRVGGWLGEPALIDEACGIATLITPERIEADRDLDVLQGSAGALLALLRLDEEVSETQRRRTTPLERAAACGEHLVHRRIDKDGQPRAWSANGYSPWCGFGHGATGIAYALARLSHHTGREEFRQAASEGLAFERLHYSPEHKNWLDLRSAEPRFMTAWCHGATGIAIGRLGMLPLIADPELTREARIALKTTKDAAEVDLDFPCCGNMGRAEALLQGAQVLGDPELELAARDLAARVVGRAKLRGGLYRWSESPDDERFILSFFTGAAGIGYTLLRLADSLSLPCVLSLE